jgi:SAM-dependent methyltransferase
VKVRDKSIATRNTQSSKLKKPGVGDAALQIAKRVVYPRHALALAKCFRPRPKDRKSAHDAELKFCADVLPGDFLNYGYYDDPSIPPDQISLHHIQQAQIRYGQLLVNEICDRQSAALDAGCGMGGLLNLLVAQGFNATALTPNRSQMQHIRARHPNLPFIEGKFDPATLQEYGQRFGTVITSESFQYIKLVPGLKTLQHVLAPSGRWILCDYFRIAETKRRSGHQWTDFNEALSTHGWKVVSQRDITANVLPTLRYLHMLGERVGMAAADFIVGKIRRKRPAVYHLLEGVIGDWRAYVAEQIETVSPEVFAREKKYMLMVMERA